MKRMFLMLFAVGLFTTSFTSCRNNKKDAGNQMENKADTTATQNDMN